MVYTVSQSNMPRVSKIPKSPPAAAEEILERFGRNVRDAAAVVDHIVETVRNAWQPTMRWAGVSDADCRAISTAFLYEGFFYRNAP